MVSNPEANIQPRFSSRLGFLLSVIGIAVGTGNIWRFPRIVAQNGSDRGAVCPAARQPLAVKTSCGPDLFSENRN